MQKQVVRCPHCRNSLVRFDGQRIRVFAKGLEIDKNDFVAKCKCGKAVSLKKHFTGKHIIRRMTAPSEVVKDS